LGKIISFDLPKDFNMATTTKKNKSNKAHRPRARKNTAHKVNSGHRRRNTRRNPSMADITDLMTTAVFTIAGAVGTQQLTQMVLTTSNTGIMGYGGNLVAAFLLSWAVKAFMKNDKAAAAVLSGGMVEIVLRLIADYTPFGQYTANLGMGDYLSGVGNYTKQNFLTPQRLVNGLKSAQLQTYNGGGAAAGMGDCYGSSLYGGRGLY
jgi:hypothetical protein